jgi:ISXO2-like transposase domain/Transposase zinc-ribbon domain
MLEDYPKTILELERRFASEDSCREYLFWLRWPNGFICPRCQGGPAWPASRGRLVCRVCRHQTSVTAGTVFQDTRKPLVLWFRAIWYVTSQKNGTSASNIQRILGLRSYQTAWTWLHKLRRAMVRPGRDKLSGRVEVDETFVGGEDPKEGTWVDQKAVVVIAAEEDGPGIGRIRLASIPAPTKKSLHRFAQETIEPGSVLHTDGRNAWEGIETLGYKRKQTVLLGRKDKNAASKLLPRVHRVASLLKRWLLGTHQGAVGAEHLDYYLDEFTFRFNRRTSRSRGKLFFRLLQQAVQIAPTTYRAMIGGNTADT